MTRYVLDTNLYIRADRDAASADGMDRFLVAFLPVTYLSAVVAQELLVGARGARRRRDVECSYVLPFERRGRLLTPSYAAWKRSAEVIALLTERRVISPGGTTRSFLNDVLLAVSCREAGVTLVTANLDDFERIRQVERFHFVPPWPDG